jgi:hypothetical protein
MSQRSSRLPADVLIDAGVLASAVAAALAAGLMLPDRQGIAAPPLRHGTTAIVGLVAFVAGWALGRWLLAVIRADPGSDIRRGVLSLGVMAAVGITTLVACAAAVRVTEVLELRAEPPRVTGMVGAFVAGLFTMQWALVAVVRDLGAGLRWAPVPIPRLRRRPATAPVATPGVRPNPMPPLAALELGQPEPPGSVA